MARFIMTMDDDQAIAVGASLANGLALDTEVARCRLSRCWWWVNSILRCDAVARLCVGVPSYAVFMSSSVRNR